MKTLIVFIHLIAACVSVGILLSQDLAFAKSRGRPLNSDEIADFKKNSQLVTLSLLLLWISGIALVVIGHLAAPETYLLNQKLWGKFSVVSILTLNGVFLHYYSFPKMTSKAGFLGVSAKEQILILVTASISLVSWLYSCYLGIARPWNGTVEYGYVMSIYAGVLLITFLVSLEFLRVVRKNDRDSQFSAGN